MTKVRTLLISLSVLSLAAVGCKDVGGEGAGSSVNTLDNYARDEGTALTVNQCGVRMTPTRFQNLSNRDKRRVARIVAPNANYQRVAAGALAAVPKPLQTMFYAADGRIRIVKNPSAYCSAAGMSDAEMEFAGENTGSINSCWKIANRKLEIILAADESMIQHSMVRMFSYVWTQFYTERLERDMGQMADDSKDTLNEGLARFKRQRSEIASAFLADLAAAKRTDVLERFLAFEKSNPKDFENFVTGEATDSRYCSAATNATFKQQFPETFKVFTASDGLGADLGPAWYEGAGR